MNIDAYFTSLEQKEGSAQGERMPSENELVGARFQGAHVDRIALKLKG